MTLLALRAAFEARESVRADRPWAGLGDPDLDGSGLRRGDRAEEAVLRVEPHQDHPPPDAR